MGLSLLNLGKKVWDQINTLDNNRTFHNPQGNANPNLPANKVPGQAPTAPRSIISQLTHNAWTNGAGDLTVKPFIINPLQSATESGRSIVADLTNNKAAAQASQLRQNKNFDNSLIGGIGNMVWNTGDVIKNLPGAVMADIHGFQGKAPTASEQNALNTGLKSFHKTPLAMVSNPAEDAMTKFIPGAKETAVANGYDADASFAKKYISDPVQGTLSVYGLMKGAEGIKNGRAVTEPAAVESTAEAAAKVAAEKPTVTAKGVVDNAVKEITKAKADPGKAPTAFDRIYKSTRDVIAKHGEGGKEIARRLDEQRNASEIGQQAFADQIPNVLKLGKDFPKFVDTLDAFAKGKPVTDMTANIASAIAEWRKAIPSIRERAVKAGLDVGDLGENYFPREYTDLKGPKLNEAIQHLQDSGAAKTPGEAVKMIRDMQKDYQRPMGNLEKSRLTDLPGYEKTPTALLNYLSRSMERITKAEQFGPNSEILNDLRAKIAKDGYDSAKNSTFDQQLKIALKDVDKSTATHQASSKIRGFNAVRSLSTAAVSNATQLTNTATVGGIFKTLKGIGKVLTDEPSRASARETGVLLDHTINDLANQGLGVKGKVLKNIASPLFNTVEKFNRQVTAVVGKDFATDLLNKAKNGSTAAEQILRDKLGVKGELGDALTRDQEIQASRKMVEISQFKVDPMDLPGWVDSPGGKLVAQFRTFGYKQTEFMYNEVLREAVKGNFTPLIRFTLVGVPAGAGSIALKNLLALKTPDQDQSKADIAWKAFQQVGGGGVPLSEEENLRRSIQYGKTLEGVGSLMGGPTGGYIGQTADSVDKAADGNYKAGIKQAVSSIPLVGKPLSNLMSKSDDAAKAPPKAGTQAAKKGDAKKELADYKTQIGKGNGEGYGLQQLSDGSYAYNIGGEVKTTTDKKAAQKAIAKDSFTKSDEDSRIVGETYYYKDESGDVKSMKTELHNFNGLNQKNSLRMDQAYRAGNLEEWTKAADSQYTALEDKKKLYNPNTEQDKIDAITNQQQDLLYKLKGYTEKGINGVGGSGGSSKAKAAAAALDMNQNRYTVSAKAASVPKFTVTGGSGGGGGSISRRAIAKPKITLKKSKV